MVFPLCFQGSLPIYSNRIAVSAIDNVLLVHQVDAKVVIMYDLFADSRAPISAPLPLLLRLYPRAASLCSSSTSRNSDALETQILTDTESITYGDGWSFLVPDLICDVTNGLLWKINIDLEASFCGCLHSMCYDLYFCCDNLLDMCAGHCCQ